MRMWRVLKKTECIILIHVDMIHKCPVCRSCRPALCCHDFPTAVQLADMDLIRFWWDDNDLDYALWVAAVCTKDGPRLDIMQMLVDAGGHIDGGENADNIAWVYTHERPRIDVIQWMIDRGYRFGKDVCVDRYINSCADSGMKTFLQSIVSSCW